MVYVNKKKKVLFVFLGLVLVVGVLFAYRVGRTITIVAGSEGEGTNGVLPLFPSLPIPEEDRINILVLGIRGLNGEGSSELENGEYLADTIILVSFNKKNSKAALVSIPRDLYIDMPHYGKKEKVNSAYAIGELPGFGGGLEYTHGLFSMITGVHIDHVVRMDFKGFETLIDQVGGITIYRDTPFSEAKQWAHDGREGKPYWRKDKEGWTFYVPEGENFMSSEDALYYARSRYSSSDFDRMKRQQEVISRIKTKVLNLGELANPVKVLQILKILENHLRVKSFVEGEELTDLVKIAKRDKIQDLAQVVLDDSPQGLLVADTIDGRFVLLPKIGDYLELTALFNGIVQ
jgi:LCP family protein required for cell wall assembly